MTNPYVPNLMLPALGWLWKYHRVADWFKVVYAPLGVYSIDVKLPPRDSRISETDYNHLKRWVDQCYLSLANNLQGSGELAVIYASSRIVGEGPKVFSPTYEQCQAMLNVEVLLPKEFYSQPYPAFVVNFPKEMRVGKFPHFSIASLSPDGEALFVSASAHDWSGLTNIMSLKRGMEPTLESAIRRRCDIIGPESDYQISEQAIRLTVNFALMLSKNPHTLEYQDACLAAALDTQMRNPKKRYDAVQRKTGLIQRIIVDQQTRFYKDERSHTTGEPTGFHASPATHWRRGHWRRERGFREIVAAGKVPKAIFIAPVMVNPPATKEGPQSVTYRMK